MKLPRCPHRWDVSPKRAIRIQRDLADRVVHEPLPRRPTRIAGADMAFTPDGESCVAGVVVWDRRRQAVLEERVSVQRVRFPYVPGLLSFREAPAVLATLRKLHCVPDVLLMDGQGFAHPRRMGLACHIGVVADLPTIGCAKSRLCGEHREPGTTRGCRRDLLDGEEVIGSVVRSRARVKCIYVSVGHRATLGGAVDLVLSCCTRYRLPEPTRLAHRLVTRQRGS